MGRTWLRIAALAGLLAAPARALTAQDGQAARDAYGRALALEASGQFDAALPLLWYAAGKAPRDAEVLNRLGESLDRIGALDAAAEAFQRAVEARPDFHKAWNNLVLTLVRAGRGAEAAARARAAAAAAPSDPDAILTLGLALSEQDVDAAIATFRRALALAPRHALAQFNLALVLKRADRVAEATAAFRSALAIEPRAETHYQLGVLYWQQGELDHAAAELDAAIAADARYAEAHYALGAVRAAQGDSAGAATALSRAIALRPALAGAHYTLGRVLQQRGDGSGAAAAFAEAERLQRVARLEREAGTRTAVGSQRLNAGDLTGALEQFRRATEVLDTYAPAHYQIGLVLQRLGQPEAARAAFARAAQLNPALTPP